MKVDFMIDIIGGSGGVSLCLPSVLVERLS